MSVTPTPKIVDLETAKRQAECPAHEWIYYVDDIAEHRSGWSADPKNEYLSKFRRCTKCGKEQNKVWA